MALGPLPASQGHSWDNGHSRHRKEICPVAEERGLSAPHPRLLSADISLTRKSPSKGAQSGEARWPAAAAHVARNTARPSPKHRAGVGPRPLTEPSARRGPLGVHLQNCPPFLLRPFSGREGGRVWTAWFFFLFFSAAFTGHQENLLEQGPGPLRQRRAGLVPPGARLSH